MEKNIIFQINILCYFNDDILIIYLIIVFTLSQLKMSLIAKKVSSVINYVGVRRRQFY